MKAVRAVLHFLKRGGVKYVFGIPAGSVNAFFDELYDMKDLTPIIVKHEGAASYMAASYAKYVNGLSVCIASSGPGATNLISGCANAMREHLPVLFLTGAVPVSTVGLNASQELHAEPIFRSITKYSVTVNDSKDLLTEVAKAVEIAVSGVPGPVHIAMPIDVQLDQVDLATIPPYPKRTQIYPDMTTIKQAAIALISGKTGYIFVGQGARGSVPALLEVAEMLQWPIIVTPQGKGLIPDDHPLFAGVYGFAGHESASKLLSEGDGKILLIVGSSLGETATNNWNSCITKDRVVIQLDFDSTVFRRKYEVDIPILGDIDLSLLYLSEYLKDLGLTMKSEIQPEKSTYQSSKEYNSQDVLLKLQEHLPAATRYTIDIGEFMAYVVHYMNVLESDTFDINIHFGAMGQGIGAAFGSKLAEPERPVVCITGDGCFFMHGMEMLTAKEYKLPILFVIMNNARLGMVYHGHSLQYQRAHPRFEQQPVNITAMAEALGIPSIRVESMEDINKYIINHLMSFNGPTILEISLVDENTPPMGERVKFLSSFGKQ
ncbi:thiamine pyrophosphate-binding protein [Anaerobacillus sp. CMMVII]|uniref:thiamine pyrophosphate-binding protein n=1 Tax=Anaerobacillus sp. CMMVII TaxID=2755588 RepID=UPI0021B7A126|nr:thiamine pyrophosphate-binding protein [Anaerobacillus sp. CMMVII]MCT8140022.1 thiamine pyrophosphate-binding protein [Anaerobacillus sp. CMMVII]